MTPAQSLTRRVAAAINDRGRGTAADLMPQFTDCTLRQVIDALHNAQLAGLIRLEKRGGGLGQGRGWAQSTYARVIRPVNSVFDLGACFATHL